MNKQFKLCMLYLTSCTKMHVALYFHMGEWNVAYIGPIPTDIRFDKRVWFQTTNKELNINTSTSLWNEIRRQSHIHIWGPMKRVFSHLVQKEYCSDLVLENGICQLIMYGVYYYAPRPKNLESVYSFRMTILSRTATELKMIFFRYHMMVLFIMDTVRVWYVKFNCKLKRSLSGYLMQD
jgi:hypothetical protein